MSIVNNLLGKTKMNRTFNNSIERNNIITKNFILALLFLSLLTTFSVQADDTTPGSGTTSGSEDCDNETIYNCTNVCSGDNKSSLTLAQAKALIASDLCWQCEPPLPTGSGGKVTVGWGEYFHNVVDYKRDPTQGSGCNSCLFGGTASDTSLPSLEVVRFFGSRDSASVGFSGGWQHNYGQYLQINSRKSAPTFVSNGGNSILVIQPGKRKGGDIGFSEAGKDGLDWVLSETGSVNAGLFKVTATAGLNTWAPQFESMWPCFANHQAADLIEDVLVWKDTENKPVYFLIKYNGAAYYQVLYIQTVLNIANSPVQLPRQSTMRDIASYATGNNTWGGSYDMAETSILPIDSPTLFQSGSNLKGILFDSLSLPISSLNPIAVKDSDNIIISYNAPVSWSNASTPTQLQLFDASKIGTKFDLLDYDNNRLWKFEVLAEGMPLGLSTTWFNGHAMITWQGDRSNNGVTLNYNIVNDKAFLNTATDDYGHQLTYHWFAHPWGYDFINKITLPTGDEINYEYRANGVYVGAEINDDEYRFIDDETNRGGVFFDYDGYGILRRVIYPDANESFYARNRDSKGLYLIFQDAAGNPTSRKDRVWLDEFLGRAYQVMDAENRITFLREDDDSAGIVRSFTFADGSKTRMEWTGWPATISNFKNGAGSDLYNYAFDSKRRILSATDSDGNTISYTYNLNFYNKYRTVALNGVIHSWKTYTAEGKLATQKNADGLLLVQTWLPNGKLTKAELFAAEDVTNELPNVGATPVRMEEWLFDVKGRLVSHQDKGGHKTLYSYDDTQYGDLVTITNPDDDLVASNNPVVRFTYNARGLKSSVIDPEGRIVRYEYNIMGNLISTIFGDSTEENLTYGTSNLGNLSDYAGTANLPIARTDRNGNITKLTYDKSDRVIKQEVFSPTGVTPISTTQRIYDTVTTNLLSDIQDGDRVDYEYLNGRKVAEKTYPNKTEVYTKAFQYDLKNRLVSQIDHRGLKTSYFYNAIGKQVQTRRELVPTPINATPIEAITKTTYDLLTGNMISTEDAIGRITRFDYNEFGNQTKTILPDDDQDADNNPTITQIYNIEDQVIATLDPLGRTTQFHFDARGNRTKIIYADGGEEIFVYSKSNNVIQVIDANGQSAFNEYGLCCSRLVGTTDTMGRHTAFLHDGNGNILETTDNLGQKSKTVFDALNRPVKNIDKMGNIYETEYLTDGSSYDATLNVGQGSAVIQKNPLGNSVTSVSDGIGRNIRSNSASGNHTTMAYTFENDIEKYNITNASGNSSSRSTNGIGAVISQTDALGNTTMFYSDLAGRTLEVEAANGVITHQELNARNQVISSVEDFGGLNITTVRSYNIAGELVSITDANHQTTSYLYDIRGRKTQELFADGSFKKFTFSPSGRFLDTQDTRGNLVSFTYNAGNQPLSIQVNRASGVGGTTLQQFTYDGLGRLLTTFDNNDPSSVADDVLCAFTYDPLNRVSIESQNGNTITNIFDSMHKTWQYNPNGDRLRFQYNVDGLPTQVLFNGAVVSTNQYTNLNQLQTRTLGNGIIVNQSYNANGALLDIHAKKNNQERLHLSYAYDSVGRKTSETDNLDIANSEQYTFDNANRLTSWNRGVENQTWQLDPLANWLSTTNNGVTESRLHDSTNAITSKTVGVATENITHDLDGNLKSDSKFAYFFDGLNRLIEVRSTNLANIIAQYKYDSINRRISKIIGNTSTTYVYTGWQVAEENELLQKPKKVKITTRSYSYGPYIDEPIMMQITQPNGNKKNFWYLHNQQFSVYALLNENGKTVETYRYSAYGHPIIENANGATLTSSAHDNTYMYTGRNLDSETGLQYFRNRYYSDSNGGFISRDPISYIDGMNLYNGYFVISYTDPKGLSILGWIFGTDPQPFSYFHRRVFMHKMNIHKSFKTQGVPFDDVMPLSSQFGWDGKCCIAYPTEVKVKRRIDTSATYNDTSTYEYYIETSFSGSISPSEINTVSGAVDSANAFYGASVAAQAFITGVASATPMGIAVVAAVDVAAWFVSHSSNTMVFSGVSITQETGLQFYDEQINLTNQKTELITLSVITRIYPGTSFKTDLSESQCKEYQQAFNRNLPVVTQGAY